MLTIPEVKQLCAQYKLKPSKNRGQNFLINEMPIEKMISACEITKSDTVVEIGPGFGALTLALAKKAKKVIAFEVEKKLQNYWDELLFEKSSSNNIEIIWQDALAVLAKNNNINLPSSYKVVANLPYQITSPIIRTFLESGKKPKSMTIMVQKEVAERICASPPNMSLLSVAVQFYSNAKIVVNAPKTFFWPQPKVDSAVIKLDNIQKKHNIDEKKFFKVVRAGFANKRKKLSSNLSGLLNIYDKSIVSSAFEKAKLNANVRAQELSVEQWIELVIHSGV
ncbi:MAG: 16S rRNA (adenine(1518)-N(6)/adenine(1519)-N(6))-dimethyltransferase RsmA [bacterium]